MHANLHAGTRNDQTDIEAMITKRDRPLQFRCRICGVRISFTLNNRDPVTEHFLVRHSIGNIRLTEAYNEDGSIAMNIVKNQYSANANDALDNQQTIPAAVIKPSSRIVNQRTTNNRVGRSTCGSNEPQPAHLNHRSNPYPNSQQRLQRRQPPTNSKLASDQQYSQQSTSFQGASQMQYSTIASTSQNHHQLNHNGHHAVNMNNPRIASGYTQPRAATQNNNTTSFLSLNQHQQVSFNNLQQHLQGFQTQPALTVRPHTNGKQLLRQQQQHLLQHQQHQLQQQKQHALNLNQMHQHRQQLEHQNRGLPTHYPNSQLNTSTGMPQRGRPPKIRYSSNHIGQQHLVNSGKASSSSAVGSPKKYASDVICIE